MTREKVYLQIYKNIRKQNPKEEEIPKLYLEKFKQTLLIYLDENIPNSVVQEKDSAVALATILRLIDRELKAAKMPISQELKQKIADDYLHHKKK